MHRLSLPGVVTALPIAGSQRRANNQCSGFSEIQPARQMLIED
jgi:hypothetical protein